MVKTEGFTVRSPSQASTGNRDLSYVICHSEEILFLAVERGDAN